MSFTFIKVDIAAIDNKVLNNFPEKAIFTTKPWINFIERDSKFKTVLIRILHKDVIVGYFTSLLFIKFGIKIIASPFPGWSTPYMGLDLNFGVDKIEVINDLVPFLFRTEHCHYIRITDRTINEIEAKQAGFYYNQIATLELKVNLSDDAIFKNMKTDCRNYIRQFERKGAKIEVAIPDEVFAREYYDQLKDVFAKQKLVPNYSVDKVIKLLQSLQPENNVLCLRVLDPEGKSIATSIFPGYNKKFFFWGGASYREYQHYRPNEFMIWTAIKYWRERGCEIFDMVGVRPYKKKFGPSEVNYVALIFPKYNILRKFEKLAARMFYLRIRALGKLKGKK